MVDTSVYRKSRTNGYGHGQDQDIRQNISNVREPKKRHKINASASRNGEIPKKRNRRALESNAKDGGDT